ncbi:MAG: branched-chain-amino-acid transaminase [Gemmatales bacterium]
MKVYIDGKYYDKQDAKISVYDHGLLYGDGVFEGIRVYHGKVFKLKAHTERLFDSAKSIGIKCPWTQRQVAQVIVDTVKQNPGCEYLRPIITRGVGNLGIDARKCEVPSLIVIADTISLYPKECYEIGLNVATVATMRNHPAATNARVKSLNYLNNVMARMEATLSNCQEALMLNHKGEVSECSGDNIFLVKRGEIYTPGIDAGILEGITRQCVIDLARKAGLKVHECALSRFDVFVADECFLTGTAAEIVPVATVDGRTIGTGKAGPVTRKLLAAYKELVTEPEDAVTSLEG